MAGALRGVKFTQAYACSIIPPTHCSFCRGRIQALSARLAEGAYDAMTDARNGLRVMVLEWNVNGGYFPCIHIRIYHHALFFGLREKIEFVKQWQTLFFL